MDATKPTENIWEISYSSISFFERVLKTHKKVESFERESDNVFHITKNNYTELKIILVDRYTLSLSDVLKAVEDFGEYDCIVTCANWNAYTEEAKEWGLTNHKGVFDSSEFFGALWWDTNIWKYAKKDKDGNPIYHTR
jgi:hypothetical protein